LVDYVGSFFVADAATGATAAAAGSGAAAGGAAAGTGAAAGGAVAGGAAAGTAGSAAVAAGTTVATESGGAGLVAGTGTAAASGSGVTLGGAAAAVTAASALYQLSQGGKGINVPPSPNTGASSDQSEVDAQQEQLKRQQAAGGLQSTTGTAGGQAGAVLNPSTLSNKSLLGG
jgi:hypothetical protein